MAKTIDLTIKFKVSELKKMISHADRKIVDKKAFEAFIQTDKFKKVFAGDILDCYHAMNCEDDSDGLQNSVDNMFPEDVVAYAEYDNCFED